MKVRQAKDKTTWNDYKARILRVLTHVQGHLDEPLDLEALARVACFSSFHFHRVFAAMTGETIADHVRRLRLERAALELRSGAKQVIQLALDAGYEAHEAFSRAFKTAYGISPAAFRRATGPVAILAAPSGVHFRPGIPLTTFKTNHITRRIMKVTTRKIKPMRVAYLRHIGPYERTRETWNDITGRLAAEQQLRPSSVFIGIGHDNPNDVPAAELRYDACITVDEEYTPKTSVQLQTIAGGDYAIVGNCPVGKIPEAFQYLFGKWLARSARELRPAPSFVVMIDAQKTIAPAKRRVDLHVPLQPKRHVNKSEQMSIEVTTLQPRRVAYMRHVGPYREAYRTWKDFIARLNEDGGPGREAVYIGVPLDDPKVTPEDKLRYDACVTVDEDYVPKKPVRVQTIAGGDYGVVRNCPIGAIAKGYENIYRTWLPESGRTVRKAPSFLVAVNGQEEMPPGFGFTDIYVPLEAIK